MLIIDQFNTVRRERMTLLLESNEALKIIETLSYLLRDPAFKVNHLKGPNSRLDLIVINPDGTPKLAEPLQAIAHEYFETKAK